ncbi:hypothetical protein mRhiFer1_008433 [Rhinolophus ferrumequinum]|uniref:Uncharacterized protein n=1 Tax=Rhinolophus ferrumequinum TaxID=59479 RepID=A0A7J7V875_RHIFE|nr:hypothetical protein mRhiFer1_008433 [Rhinolophus ferrumequinum]
MRTLVRAASTRLRSRSSLNSWFLCVCRHQNPTEGARPRGADAEVDGGEGAPFRFPDARAGRRARAHAHWPVLAHLGLTHSLRQLGTRLPPQARPSARREAQSVWRAPEALSPAGRMSPAYVRTAPSKTTSTLACTPSRKVTRMGKAVSKRPSYPRSRRNPGRESGEGSGKKGAKGQW